MIISKQCRDIILTSCIYFRRWSLLLQHINLVITVPADALAPNNAMPSVEPELTIISDVIFQKFGGYEPINRKRVGV